MSEVKKVSQETLGDMVLGLLAKERERRTRRTTAYLSLEELERRVGLRRR